MKKEQPPETPEEFLDRAEEAMAAEKGWTFAVRGRERLVLQGQTNGASYESTVRLTQDPKAFHSTGATTSSKGVRKAEEIFVVDGTGYVKEGTGAWKQEPASEPEMKNKVEDPLSAIEEFRSYVTESGGDVTLTRQGGQVRLQVSVSSRKLPQVRERAYVEKAMRELNPTLKQLQNAGVSATEDQLTLSSLKETMILDADSYRITSHRFQFGFLIPYGAQNITFAQDVSESNKGVFEGSIELPAGVG
ncbi:DUF6612 family protein [Streptomyces himalayensis]|uniref:DUF6612 family protein n=1 Tax=Streptomyces himalayensis TaxID=2820085 RepID=UPI0028682275|nr:DUF6612 family protein [Streptomyces himalayensis]